MLRLDYRDRTGHLSTREVEPLCLAFWGGTWTLSAWCRLRADFRNFRLDRIDTAAPAGELFVELAECGLPAYVHAVGAKRVDMR